MEQFFLVLLALVFGLRGQECTFYNETTMNRSFDPRNQPCDCYPPGVDTSPDCTPGENYCDGMCGPGYHGKFCKLCMPGVTNSGTSDLPDCSSCVMKDKRIGRAIFAWLHGYQNVRWIGECLDKCRANPRCYYVTYNDRYNRESWYQNQKNYGIGYCEIHDYSDFYSTGYNSRYKSAPRNCLRNNEDCVRSVRSRQLVGGSVKITPSLSVDNCRKLCLSNDKCEFYTYDGVNKSCWTSHWYYKNILSKKGYVSAKRNCQNISEEYLLYQYSCKPGYYGTSTTCKTCWTRSKAVDRICSCRMENTHSPGIDIDYVRATSLKDCHKKCRELATCDFIDYYGNICYRKGYGTFLMNAPSSVKSGPKYCKPGQREEDCYVSGKRYYILKYVGYSNSTTTAKQCQEHCQTINAECEVFTYNPLTPRKCHFYSFVKLARENSGVIMASRNCDLLEGY